MSELLLPFQLTFMQQAFAIALAVAIPMALLSCFLVLKGWSLMGDAISHAVLPGIVLAYIIGIPLAIGAFTAGMFCAIATGYLKENSRVKEDTIMGIVFSGMFAAGLVLYVNIESDIHLDHILFGNMLGVAWSDIAESAIIAIIAGGLILAKRKDFLLFSFDPQHAKAINLPTKLLHYGLLCLLSLTIVGALKAVGLILAIALLVAPGAIAFLLTSRFSTMLVLASAVSMFSSVAGVYASFFLDSAPAPTIVLIMTAIFVIVFIANQWKFYRLRNAAIGQINNS